MNGSLHAREWIAQRLVTQPVAPARDRCLLVCKISEIFVSAGHDMRLRFRSLDVRVIVSGCFSLFLYQFNILLILNTIISTKLQFN